MIMDFIKLLKLNYEVLLPFSPFQGLISDDFYMKWFIWPNEVLINDEFIDKNMKMKTTMVK